MARITHVKKARQRYATVPVLNDDGSPKMSPVTKKTIGPDGTVVTRPKTTKNGRPVLMTVTVSDKSKPLPNRTCGRCRAEITVGSPYKHISPKSGPYGGRTLYRCAACPDWEVWEYSSSLSAQVARIAHEGRRVLDGSPSPDDVEAALAETAEQIRSLAEEKREAAANIEDGFGHPTMQSEELENVAAELDDWADTVETAEVPAYPEPEETACEDCDGTGTVAPYEPTQEQTDPGAAEQTTCETCDGTGSVTPDEATREQIDEWESEVDAALVVLDECPL